MHRSPLASLIFLLLSAALGWAQANPPSPDPKQGSGLPQTPTSGTQVAPPSSAPTPTDTKPAAPVTAPSTLPATGNQQAPNAPANSGATSGGPSSTDQQKSKAQQSTPAVAPPPPPAQPKTDILDSSATSGALTTDGHDPILDPAPVPQTTTTLVGGTITGVDRMRNRMSVHVFGGGKWTVNFDERTHI